MADKYDSVGIPIRLRQNGRQIDKTFLNEEKLFIRFSPAHFDEDGKASEFAFSTRKQSCNREKYCVEPSDVLYNIDAKTPSDHFFDWGILSIKVGEVRSILEKNCHNNDKYTLDPEHKPEKLNYPHSEIIVHKNDKPVPGVNPKSMKKRLRHRVRQLSQLEKPPRQS